MSLLLSRFAAAFAASDIECSRRIAVRRHAADENRSDLAFLDAPTPGGRSRRILRSRRVFPHKLTLDGGVLTR